MGEVIRAKDLPERVAHAAEHKKRRKAARGVEQGKAYFDGKIFADLTQSEKDDLLKVLAISFGILEE